MIFRFDLSNVARKVPFPFPLKNAGSVEGDSTEDGGSRYCQQDRLEVSLRLEDQREIAEDRIDGEIVQTPFPNVCLKYSGTLWHYEYTNRHTIFFDYACETCDIMRRDGILPEKCVWDFRLTPEIRTLVHSFREMLLHIMEENVIDRLDFTGFRILREVIYQRNMADRPPLPEHDQIMKSASHFRAYFNRDIDIDELVKQYGMSRRSFFRHWNNCFRVTPARYILSLRPGEYRRMAQKSQ